MPPQLLSPAGLPACDGFSAGSSSPIGEEDAHPASSRQFLDASMPGAGPSGRAPLKRTASTASVNAHVMDMLNPNKQAEEIARLNGHSRQGRSSSVLSSDSDDGIGTIEDWEIEQDSPAADGSTSTHCRVEEKDPFTVTPHAYGSAMMLESAGPSSSPTLALKRQRRPAAARASDSGTDDMDDADNNPFLSTSSGSSKTPRKATADHKKKISYVFRGKRITYDAPLDSLLQDDEDDEALNMCIKSGPRVLFPSPPTPAPAPPSKMEPLPAKQIVHSPESRPSVSLHLMQTPRRQTHMLVDSNASDATFVGSGSSRVSKGEADKHKDEAPTTSFIPPTPASLPQKSQKSEEQRRLERERLQNAMSGIQAAHQAVNHAGSAAAQRKQKRYVPYPPR